MELGTQGKSSELQGLIQAHPHFLCLSHGPHLALILCLFSTVKFNLTAHQALALLDLVSLQFLSFIMPQVAFLSRPPITFSPKIPLWSHLPTPNKPGLHTLAWSSPIPATFFSLPVWAGKPLTGKALASQLQESNFPVATHTIMKV